MNLAESVASERIAACERILAAAIERAEPAGAGANSRLYRLQTRDRTYALKIYPGDAGDPRNRAAVERDALVFFARMEFADTPRWFGGGPDFGILEWIDGTIALAPQAADCAAAAGFLARLHRAGRDPAAAGIPFAYQACRSGKLIADGLERRFSEFAACAAGAPELGEFLTIAVLPLYASATRRARALYAAQKLDFDRPLDTGYELISGDFGFHNMLRRPGGGTAFIDFEYFGWDDPVKVAADVIAHPAAELDPVQEADFRERMLTIYGRDRGFAVRLDALLPLIGLRWLCIILNEFLPARWALRQNTAAGADWQAVKARQLQKAMTYLQRRLFTPCR